MDITYLGHSAFRLKGKNATVVTDPYPKKAVGFTMPKVGADIVTVSHAHPDHNAVDRVGGTTRRSMPYVISAPGEYEVSGVGVFGWGSFHDDKTGADRGKNTMYSIVIDGVSVCHLGDLGHTLTTDQIEGLGMVDVLLIPVGGIYTIGPEDAVKVIAQLQPSWVIPMHYKVAGVDETTFGKLFPIEAFLKAMGVEAKTALDKLTVHNGDSNEETVTVWLNRLGEGE